MPPPATWTPSGQHPRGAATADDMPGLGILQQVIDSSATLVQLADRQYRLIAINKASADEFERIYGVRPQRGDSLLDLLSHQPRNQALVKALWGRALAGEQFSEIGEFGDEAHERRFYEMNYYPLRHPGGKSFGAFQLAYDVTDRVDSARELARERAASGPGASTESVVDAGLNDAQYRTLFNSLHEGFFVGEVVRDSGGDVVDFVFLEVNEAFTRQTGRSSRSVLGQPVRTVIPGFPCSVVQRYGAAVDTGRPSMFEVEVAALDHRSYEARVHPLGGERFAVLFLEITQRKRIEKALEESRASLGTIVDSVDQIIWAARPDGYHDFFNRRWYEYTDATPGSTEGDAWAELFHPDDRERTFIRWRHSLETGEPYEIEYRLRHRSGAYRWVLGRAHPVRNEAGEIIRWMGTCTDIHQQKVIAEQLELAGKELSHRIKNIFAVVSGIIALAARHHPTHRVFAEQLIDRLAALGQAHDYARPLGRDAVSGGKDRTMLGLVRLLLQPYALQGKERMVVDGDDTPLAPRAVTPVSLAVHELATNAAKYGAFAVPGGHIHVHGQRRDGQFELRWREHGGPAVHEPERAGFGTHLVDLTLRDQLAGRLLRTWRPEGLEVCVSVPMERLVEDSPSP